jgi:hypothetical protein
MYSISLNVLFAVLYSIVSKMSIIIFKNLLMNAQNMFLQLRYHERPTKKP